MDDIDIPTLRAVSFLMFLRQITRPNVGMDLIIRIPKTTWWLCHQPQGWGGRIDNGRSVDVR